MGTLNKPAHPPNARLAALNLLSLVVFGVVASWWVLHYTDFFPIIGGILGLGGVFAWIAFLANLVSAERKTQIQEGFDSAILQNRWFSGVILVVLLFGIFCLAPFRGTILIDNLGEGAVVKVSKVHQEKPLTENPVYHKALPPREKVKVVVPTNWFGSRNYYVKISGLPAERVVATGWRVITVTVPDTFKQRPVILIRPAVSILGSLRTQSFKLQTLIDGQELRGIDPYNGEAVWVGADENVKVPIEAQMRWRFDLATAGYSVTQADIWAKPDALAPYLLLPKGATLIANIVRRSDGGIVYSGRAKISSTGRALRFPEEVVIDVP